MASLLLAAPDAHAGTWLLQVSSSGTATATNKKPKTWTAPTTSIIGSSFTAPSLSNGQGTGANGSSVTASANLTVTVSGTWQSDPSLVSDPAPASVIVTETSTAYASDTSTDASGNPTPPVAGTADDGLNHGDTQSTSGPNVGTMTGTKYEVNPGGGSAGSFSVTITAKSGATATAGPNGTNPDGTSFVGTGSCTAGVGAITISASPVTVAISGTYAPAKGDYRALTGQQITGTLNGTIGTVTSYTWSFSGGTKGNPIKNWDPNGVAVDGTTPQQLFAFLNTDLSQTDATGNGITVNPISFYDEVDKDAVTATCAVNLTFPDGTTGSVTAKSVPVTFFKPTASWTASATPPLGPQFDPSAAGSMGFDVQWKATITVPSPFSGGLGCFAQIVQPTMQFQRTPTGSQPTYCYLKEPQQNADGTTYVLPSRGLYTYFPYQNSLTTNYPQGYTWSVSGMGQSGDAPSAGFNTPASDNGGSNWYNAFASGSFTTYLMYMPPSSATGPGGTIWVPLQTVDWSWTGSVVKNKATGSWNSATNSSPAVTGNTANSGMQTDTPPQWTSTDVGSSVLRP